MYYKVIANAHVLEVYTMERAPISPHSIDQEYDALSSMARHEVDERNRMLKYERELKREGRGDRKAERRAQTLRDSRNLCKRLAVANFDTNSAFVTLTMRDRYDGVSLTDVHFWDKEFKKFIMRMNYRYGKKHKYIAVREFHNNREALHYHLMIDFYIPADYSQEKMFALDREIAEIWGHGFVKVKNMNRAESTSKPVDNVGAYLVKYMSKEYDDERLKGNKVYLCSRGLQRPITYTGDEALAIIEAYELEQKKEIFTNSYESEYLGTINYREYNLKRDKKTVGTNS